MFRSKFLPAALVAAVAAGGAGFALADRGDNDNGDQAELAAVLDANTSLGQAIAIAEAETDGKAIEAGVEDENGAIMFEVEVAKDGQFHDVYVAMDTGAIVKVIASDSEADEHDDD